ncbi:MAG: mannose-1-phosphate guanylyltransferase [Planctomycetes bacterium]|nr:mannose-1-phosphate guanylyltransferase [Planctomycetota bacterium]
MLYAVLMAGGKGRRFWPKSRENTPKQFITLFEKKSLLKFTCERLSGMVPNDRIFVITNAMHTKLSKDILEEVPEENIIGEPEGRDTAACVAYSAAVIYKKDPDAVIVAMPADHFIRPKQKFHETIKMADDVAMNSDSLVVFGIKPRYPSTGYGYIQRGEKLMTLRSTPIYKARRFVEKPDDKTAKGYIASGEYYWNSGIFLWKAKTILDAFEKHLPDSYHCIEELLEFMGTKKESQAVRKFYTEFPKTSIDYAIMEKADNVAMIEANYIWDDIGTWKALDEMVTKNRENNVVIGKHCGIDSDNIIIFGDEDHLIGTVGISNLVIVHTQDATLICNRDRVEDVKMLVDKLDKNGLKKYI